MEEFIENFKEIFDVEPPTDLSENTLFMDIPGWDSLLTLSLIVMLSNKYRVTLDVDRIRRCTTIRDLYDAVNS
jgi:acyl carrier protein